MVGTYAATYASTACAARVQVNHPMPVSNRCHLEGNPWGTSESNIDVLIDIHLESAFSDAEHVARRSRMVGVIRFPLA